MRTTTGINPDIWAIETRRLPRSWADKQTRKSKRRFEAIFQARERHILEASATLERAGMTALGHMVPEWSVKCLIEYDSYETAGAAYRRYCNAVALEDPDNLACKVSFEQVVFQFGLASEYCGRDPEVKEAFVREVTRAFPTLSREDALALMRQFSPAAADYARSMEPEQWRDSPYADFFAAARKLPDDYQARFLDIGFQLLRMIANGYFDIPRQIEEVPLGHFRIAA